MSVLAGATLAVFGALIIAVAVTLVVVILLLWRTSATLGQVVDALDRVADRTQPLAGWIGRVNEPLATGRDALAAAAPREDPHDRPRSRAVT